MNCLNSISREEDWLQLIRKELQDDKKDKEKAYNFNFTEERPKVGRLVWEIIQDSKPSNL